MQIEYGKSGIVDKIIKGVYPVFLELHSVYRMLEPHPVNVLEKPVFALFFTFRASLIDLVISPDLFLV